MGMAIPFMAAEPGMRPLHRPRICALLRDLAAQYSLTLVIAGPRSGKSTAVRQYAEESPGCFLWLDVVRLDNHGDHLWRQTLEGIRRILPDMSEAIGACLELPLSSSMDMFVSAWRARPVNAAPLLIVYDQFEHIRYEEAYRFILFLNDAALRNLHILAAARKKDDHGFGKLLQYGQYGELTAKDLYFTPDETEALLVNRNVLHTRNQIDRIIEATGGWPHAVDEYVRQLQNHAPLPPDADFDDCECLQLLHQLWVKPYDTTTQRQLAALSLLPVFSAEHLRYVCDASAVPILIQTLSDNPFVHYSVRFRLFLFEPLYRRCLHVEAQLLYLGETSELPGVGWDWLLEHRELRESLKRYEDEDFASDMFDRMGASERISVFLRDHAKDHDEAYWQANPHKRMLMGRLYAEERQPEAALEWLEAALDACAQSDSATPMGRQLTGEVYLGIALVHLSLVQPNGMAYLKRAYSLLPHGSAMGQSTEWLLPNESTLAIMPEKPDDLDRAMRTYRQAEAMLGHGLAGPQVRGFVKLFAAEVALATFDVSRAAAEINAAMQIGMLHEQHTLVCNAHVLAARVAILRGEGGEIVDILAKLDEYIRQRHLVKQQKTYDYLISWICLQVEDMDPVPAVFKNPYVFAEMPKRRLSCREMLLHCGYMVYRGDFKQAHLMIAFTRQFAIRRRQFEQQINLYILEAYCYMREGHVDRGMEAFVTAFNMARPVGFLTPFIESGHAMRTLIQTIRRKGGHGLDEEWLMTIETKATTYAKRCNSIIHSLHGRTISKSSSISLSAREQEALALLNAGMTRKEIGEHMGITVHGVKRHLSSLYTKLDAVNRSTAIIRAEAMGLLGRKAALEESRQ